MLRPPQRPGSDPGCDLAAYLAERDRQDAETYRLIQQHQDAELAQYRELMERQDAAMLDTLRLMEQQDAAMLALYRELGDW